MTQGGARGRPRSAESAELTREVFEQLLQAAVAAPSMHNTQPWRFRVRQASRTIELRADPARQLPYSDPDGRAVHIACGAAVFNLRLAAAVAGWQASVLLLPEAARLEGAILHIPDHDESVRLLHLAADAERDLLTDLRYLAELARWTGGQRDREGIPDSALGPRSPEGSAPVRDFTPGPRSQPVRYAWFETTPQLAVLSMRSGTKADWLRAGQALQRVLLTATARGISASPLTHPLETRDA